MLAINIPVIVIFATGVLLSLVFCAVTVTELLRLKTTKHVEKRRDAATSDIERKWLNRHVA
jgi:hypothetical protein